MCAFKGGGGSVDLLVARWASMTVVGTFLWLENAWGDEGLGSGCVDVSLTVCMSVWGYDVGAV